ncbi:oligopeptide ABC transporter ATP-binding protein [Entomoplasma ellychniae]|uniref:Oligopeptide ABC transporter ATP-binding protein n=1 Tax=Entomoplasma ellychniae TaxID=2114 RepID=A0A8E2U9Q6_9MOLU|nr:oligopeptide ABC transporter ATP-binding protein OppD [Entomoplasma ellychniae]PPE04394.1 oligopeptide ABC transporter ATP-binding protein [Entomoplasma ellychniae]
MSNLNKKILSIRNLEVKFRVRSRVLTAIRNVSFDLYDGEVLALVGESGSGKSVITKTFTGMLDSNGWINDGSIIYTPNQGAMNDEKSYFKSPVDIVNIEKKLILSDVIKFVKKTTNAEISKIKKEILNLEKFKNNKLLIENEISEIDSQIVKLELFISQKAEKAKEFKKRNDAFKLTQAENKINVLNIKKEILLSVDLQNKKISDLKNKLILLEGDIKKVAGLTLKEQAIIKEIISNIESFIQTKQAITLENIEKFNSYFEERNHLVKFEKELKVIYEEIIKNKKVDEEHFANIMFDWNEILNTKTKSSANKLIREIRGKTIATVFQDPMTSLNPLLTVGFQITEVLIKQLKMSREQAKKEALKLLKQVGIPNPSSRYKDVPGQYSGGMRQRVVIAIALACRPKILICDEPTTALDVTIQAQILKLIKDLQKEYHFSVIFITHDLGVVANISDRVAVMYAGQIIEIGTTEEIFNNAKHPYTWALLLSLPQLGTKGEDLYSIGGTPPSLFNEIKGDAFAPRNKYALAIDYLHEPPMFKVSETHYAKTWLLHAKADKNIGPKKTKSSVLSKAATPKKTVIAKKGGTK